MARLGLLWCRALLVAASIPSVVCATRNTLAADDHFADFGDNVPVWASSDEEEAAAIELTVKRGNDVVLRQMSLLVEYFEDVNFSAGNHSVFEVFVKAGTLEESIEFTVSRPNCVGCVGAQCDVCVSYEDTMSGDELGWRESGYDERRINNWLGPDETWLRVFKGEAIIADDAQLEETLDEEGELFVKGRLIFSTGVYLHANHVYTLLVRGSNSYDGQLSGSSSNPDIHFSTIIDDEVIEGHPYNDSRIAKSSFGSDDHLIIGRSYSIDIDCRDTVPREDCGVDKFENFDLEELDEEICHSKDFLKLHGDPHFNCPAQGSRFDFDGDLEKPGKRQFYTLLADDSTNTAVNLAFLPHVVHASGLKKTMSHTVGLFISGMTDNFMETTIELSYNAKPVAGEVKNLLPSLRVDGEEMGLDNFMELHNAGSSVSTLDVYQAQCSYMQPEKFLTSKLIGKKYSYQTTSNLCTHININMHYLKLEIVAIPAAYESDGVGVNYFNVNVKEWRHAPVKQLHGILSHCYDDTLDNGSCPKCFSDEQKSISDFPMLGGTTQMHAKTFPTLVSDQMNVVSDHEWSKPFANGDKHF